MELIYRAYARKLEAWTSADADDGDRESRMAELSEMESAFIAEARRIGERVESDRTKHGRNAGRETTLHEMAVAMKADAEFAKAAAAVAEVSRRRVEALRTVERIRDGIVKEREKISRAKKVNRMYTSRRESGRRINGQA